MAIKECKWKIVVALRRMLKTREKRMSGVVLSEFAKGEKGF